jgi:hypothetical protein
MNVANLKALILHFLFPERLLSYLIYISGEWYPLREMFKAFESWSG